MKNGSIADQLEMQERQISDERKNADMQICRSADKQTELNENKQDNSNANIQTESQEYKKEDKQSFSLPDLGLSSALGLLTPDVNKEEEQELPVKRKKKKPKRGFRR